MMFNPCLSDKKKRYKESDNLWGHLEKGIPKLQFREILLNRWHFYFQDEESDGDGEDCIAEEQYSFECEMLSLFRLMHIFFYVVEVTINGVAILFQSSTWILTS